MFELLYKYNIDVKDSAYAEKDAERPRKRSRLNLEVIPVEAFPRTTQDFEPEILPVETQFLINRDFNPIDPGEPSNHIDPGEPSNPINPGEPSKLLLQLPDKKGFLPLSQHCLLQPFAAETFHKVSSQISRKNEFKNYNHNLECIQGYMLSRIQGGWWFFFMRWGNKILKTGFSPIFDSNLKIVAIL